MIRFRSSIWVAALSIVLSATALTAQPSSQPIVVTGELPAKAREQARSYLREVGVATGDQQAARWFDPICPRAFGLGKVHAAIVEQQIRQIIRDVGAPLAKEGCTSNFSIAFTDGAEKVARRIAASGARLRAASARELKEGEAPVRWWYNTELRTRDGLPASHVPAPAAGSISDSQFIPLPTGRSGNLSLYSSSIVSTQAVRAIHSATVVVDVQRSDGMPLKSVVDYAAAVGLSEIKLGASPSRSILSLFELGGERRLTKRDRAFLTALYRIQMDRRARQQRKSLMSAMVDSQVSN